MYECMEEVLFKTETTQSRADVAAYLRTIADRLDGDGEVTLSAGEQSQTLSVPARPVFEVKVEREQSKSGPAELSIELELEWDEGDDGTDSSLEVS
jgi:amphi-Trp domain-containing protein